MSVQMSRKEIGMVAVLLFGALIVVLNATLLNPALPTVMEDFGISATTAQWLTSAYTLTESVVIPLSAFFVGRFSTRKLFLGGMTTFAVGSVIAALAPVFPVLLLGRVCQALAGGVIMPMVVTLIMLIFPREQRGSAMGLVTLVISFAPTIGPVLGGLLIDSIGWRYLFVIVAVCALVVLCFAAKFIYNFEGFERYGLDVPSVVLMVCGMVCLLYGISSITSAAQPLIYLALIIAGIVLLGVFAYRQMQLEQPMLKVSVLKSRRFRTDVIAIFIMQMGLLGNAVILPLYIQNVLGYSATVSGLVMLPGAVLGAIVGLLAGRAFDRYGVRGLAVGGVTILLLGAIGASTFAIDSPLYYVICWNILLSLGSQMITTPLNTWGVNSLDNSVIQHANSLSNSLNQVAGSIGTAFLTSLTALGPVVAPNGTALEQTFAGDHLAFCGLLVLSLICALVVYVFVRDRKGEEAKEGAREELQQAAAAAGAATWTVADAMDAEPKFVREGQTVGDAFDLFAATETSGVPVVDDGRRVVGYLSDGDVMDYLGKKDVQLTGNDNYFYNIADDKDMQENLVVLFELDAMRIATKKVISLEADATLSEACATFASHKLKKAPVVKDGKLVGSLSRRNIVSYIAAHSERGAKAGEAAAAAGASVAGAGEPAGSEA